MALLYSLPSPHGHPYYAASQLTALALYVALLLGQGYRRGYAWRTWLPLVAASTLGLLLGCQLVGLPLGQWLAWLRGDAAALAAVAAGPRSILGGAVASLLAVLAVRRPLGVRGWGVLDAFGGPLCWALAVQCVGCLLVGCCWGETLAQPSGLGLCYAPGTLPYLAQQARGLLPAGAAHALPVVPTQLYALLLCAGAGLVLHAVRRRAGWPPGSRYLLALGLLAATRFLLDFWRDPASEPLGGTALALAGLALLRVQWLMLLAAGLLLGGWAWLVRRATLHRLPAPEPTAAAYPALVALGLLAATTRLAAGPLHAPETLLLQALLLAVLGLAGHAGLASLGRLPQLAGLPLSALLGSALLLTAQAPAPLHQPLASQQEPAKTVTVGLGLMGSAHNADENILSDHSGCSGSTPMRLHQRVRAGGADVAVTTTYDAHTTSTIGGGLWVGQQQVEVRSAANGTPAGPDSTLRYVLFDAHLYKQQTVGHDWLTFGYRAGLHFGDLGHYSYFDSGNTAGALNLLPEFMLSLGNPRLLYGQADFGYGAENALGACTSRLALGSGLGQLGGSQVLAGLAHAAHAPTQNMAFVSANLRLSGGTGFSALSLEPYFATDFGQHQLFSLKLNYRLNK